ncbi:uncharacterized protein LOC131680525 [Topomyia yanbarensis]|uniref:uncharacterized protein LOC131680525 n=1 Tax=Topomyia yanbarensis TaxID=2498891 RepID=UPI00273AD89D|nr:uncharacterized protein LOC131680525 [Topomyia yanbarensis]
MKMCDILTNEINKGSSTLIFIFAIEILFYFSSAESAHPDIDMDTNIVDILEYVGEAVQPIKEGFAVYAANHIVCIGYRMIQRSNIMIEVVGYVTPFASSDHAYLNVSISKWVLKCSCKAGTIICKQIVVCLLLIEK